MQLLNYIQKDALMENIEKYTLLLIVFEKLWFSLFFTEMIHKNTFCTNQYLQEMYFLIKKVSLLEMESHIKS